MSEQCQRQPQNVPLRKKILKKKKCKQQHQKPAADENTLTLHLCSTQKRDNMLMTMSLLYSAETFVIQHRKNAAYYKFHTLTHCTIKTVYNIFTQWYDIASREHFCSSSRTSYSSHSFALYTLTATLKRKYKLTRQIKSSQVYVYHSSTWRETKCRKTIIFGFCLNTYFSRLTPDQAGPQKQNWELLKQDFSPTNGVLTVNS